ncbi:MAG: hypothetical protein QMC79_09290 [Anaerosomatales bacterium]|nr:hypothetical protein [Anaerosomatales bacterium]
MEWLYRYGPPGSAVYVIRDGYVYPIGEQQPAFSVRGDHLYSVIDDQAVYHVRGGFVYRVGETTTPEFFVKPDAPDAPDPGRL